jgi:hypothetical protein
MSEESNGGFFSNLKNQVLAGGGVILTGIGTMFMDEVKSFIGIEDEEEGGAKTELVQEQKQENNQSVNVTGPEIIINIPEQKTETKTVIKEVPAKKPEKKKEKEELLDW